MKYPYTVLTRFGDGTSDVTCLPTHFKNEAFSMYWEIVDTIKDVGYTKDIVDVSLFFLGVNELWVVTPKEGSIK